MKRGPHSTGPHTPGVQDSSRSVAKEGSKGGSRNLEPKSTPPMLNQNIEPSSNPSWDTQKRKDLSQSGSGTAAEMKKAGL